MSIPIAFIICTEPGNLEKQSILLVKSIRTFGGSLKDIPIYSFQPRKGANINKQTLNFFDSHGVSHQKILLNQKYPLYGVANKPFVCAYAEETIDADTLVFLDSDQCFFSAPTELLLPEQYDVAVRPEDFNLIGSKGENDKNEEYWRTLYDICQVKNELFVTTTVDNQKIRAYWNSGMVAVKRNKRIFTTWRNNFVQVMEQKIQPERGLFFVEQSVLSATICSTTDAILTLPINYNYPLNSHHKLAQVQKLKSFDHAVSIHYHKIFRNQYEQALEKLDVDKSTAYKWLYEEIKNQKLSVTPWDNYKANLKKDVYSLIKRLQLNYLLEKLLKRPLP